MAETLHKGWLKTRDNEKFAPATLIENVYARDGTPYDDVIKEYIANNNIIVDTNIVNVKNQLTEQGKDIVDLQNKDQILEAKLTNFEGSDSDTLYVIDGSSRVIAKIDNNGVHSIDFTIPNVTSLSSVQQSIETINTSIVGINQTLENVNTDDSSTLYIVDGEDRIVAKIDANGVHSINFNVPGQLDYISLIARVDSNQNDIRNEIAKQIQELNTAIETQLVDLYKKHTELTERIKNFNGDDSNTFYIIDDLNRIIAKIDNGGVHSINFSTPNQDFNTLNTNVNNEITTRTEQVAQLMNKDATIESAIVTLDQKYESKLKNFDGSDSDVFYITDNNGNIIAKIDAEGVHSVNFVIYKDEIDAQTGAVTRTRITLLDLSDTITNNVNSIRTLIQQVNEINTTSIPALSAEITTNATSILDIYKKIVNFNDNGSDALHIIDNENRIIAKVDHDGVHSIDVTAYAWDSANSQYNTISLWELHAFVNALEQILQQTNNELDEVGLQVEQHATTITEQGKQINKNTGDIAKVPGLISDAIAQLVGTAPENLNTIYELAAWIENDTSGAAAMSRQIAENKTNIETLAGRADSHDTEITTIKAAIKNFNGDDSDTFYIVDGQDRVIAKFNADGLTTTNIEAQSNVDVKNELTVQNDLKAKSNVIVDGNIEANSITVTNNIASTQGDVLAGNISLINVSSLLDQAVTDITTIKGTGDGSIAKAVSDMHNTLVNGATVYDTFGEVEDWIIGTNHTSGANATINDHEIRIDTLETTVGDSDAGLVKDVLLNTDAINTINVVLGNESETSGLRKRIKDLESNKAENSTVEALAGRVGQNESNIDALQQTKANQSDLLATNETVSGNQTEIASIKTAIRNFNGDDSNTFYIIDNEDRIIAKFNSDGLTTTNISTAHDLSVNGNTTIDGDAVINGETQTSALTVTGTVESTDNSIVATGKIKSNSDVLAGSISLNNVDSRLTSAESELTILKAGENQAGSIAEGLARIKNEILGPDPAEYDTLTKVHIKLDTVDQALSNKVENNTFNSHIEAQAQVDDAQNTAIRILNQQVDIAETATLTGTVNAAKNEIIGTATSAYNTLGKIENVVKTKTDNSAFNDYKDEQSNTNQELRKSIDENASSIVTINGAIKNFNGDDSDVFYIIDNSNRVIAKFNSDGLTTTNIAATREISVDDNLFVGNELKVTGESTFNNKVTVNDNLSAEQIAANSVQTGTLFADGTLNAASINATTTITAGTTIIANNDIESREGNIRASNGDVIAEKSVSAGTTITANRNITSTQGNIIATAGNITANNGDISATNGNISAGAAISAGTTVTAVTGISAGTTITAGTTVTAGSGITATQGSIVASNGPISAAQGVTAGTTVTAGQNIVAGTTITAGSGISTTTGNITAEAGSISANQAVSAGTTVTAGQTITANGNITSTAGNIVATAGSISAGNNITAVNGIAGKTVSASDIVVADRDVLVGDISLTTVSGRVDTLQGNANTEGSVAYSVNQLKTTLMGDATTYKTFGQVEDQLDLKVNTSDFNTYTTVTAPAAISQAVTNAVSDLVNDAPETLDTLGELAQWINDDESGAAAMSTQIINLQNRLLNFDGSDSDVLYIVDGSNRVIAKFNANGLMTTNVILKNNLSMQENSIFFGEYETLEITL